MKGEIQVTHIGPTFQGSGHLIGQRQFFIRLAGCNHKRCPIRVDCDERYSLGAQNGGRKSVIDCVDLALDAVGVGGWLHITGGEPTDHGDRLEDLVQRAQREGLRVHLQTAGHVSVDLPVDWLTVSPKVPARKLEQCEGNELLVVYTGQEQEELVDFYEQTRFMHYFLQPLWVDAPRGEASNSKDTAQTLHELNEAGGKWAFTIQAHKYWGIK
jgi:organic radical activating enzyme